MTKALAKAKGINGIGCTAGVWHHTCDTKVETIRNTVEAEPLGTISGVGYMKVQHSGKSTKDKWLLQTREGVPHGREKNKDWGIW